MTLEHMTLEQQAITAIIKAYLRLLMLGDFTNRHTSDAQTQLSELREYICDRNGYSSQFVQEEFEAFARAVVEGVTPFDTAVDRLYNTFS